MGKINRLKVQNSFTKKIITIILFLLIGSGLVFVAYKIINKSMSELAYDLGEKSSISGYQDKIIRSYEEYLKIVEEYGIEQNLKANNFVDNYYLLSFQNYDSCAESRFKEVIAVNIEKDIEVQFKIHNKCGWCKSHLALHLIKISKVDIDKKINYTYEYAKELNCGTI